MTFQRNGFRAPHLHATVFPLSARGFTKTNALGGRSGRAGRYRDIGHAVVRGVAGVHHGFSLTTQQSLEPPRDVRLVPLALAVNSAVAGLIGLDLVMLIGGELGPRFKRQRS